MKLTEWARREGVHYQTAWKWWKAGKLPVPARKLPSGMVVVDVPETVSEGKTVAYCRLSSADQKADLERQAGRVVTAATARGLTIAQVVTEIGSGLNGNRRQLHRILADPTVSTIVVEHRDRLARFGVDYLVSALRAHGRKVVVLDEEETTDDLVGDITEVLTSMCARLYGRRSAENRVRKAMEVVTAPDGS